MAHQAEFPLFLVKEPVLVSLVGIMAVRTILIYWRVDMLFAFHRIVMTLQAEGRTLFCKRETTFFPGMRFSTFRVACITLIAGNWFVNELSLPHICMTVSGYAAFN